MKKGMVVFAGAGPGAVDLLTIRCRNAIAEAELIIYAGSLVNPDVLKFANPLCEIVDSSSMNLPEVIHALTEAVNKGCKVLRLHTGDPAMYGAITEQMNALDKAGIQYEVIPGVSSVFAVAASLKTELTLPGISQTVIMGRRSCRTPVPEKENIKALATHGATMVLFLSVSEMEELVSELQAGGYSKDTSVAVVYRASWSDEKIVTGTLSNIAVRVIEAGIKRQAIVIVGNVLRKGGALSCLYAPDFSHTYRNTAGFYGSTVVYALTESGCKLAMVIGAALNGEVLLSEKHPVSPSDISESIRKHVKTFNPEKMSEIITENWTRFDGHIFIMSAGIVVRKIAPLLMGKTEDPAVVVCDEKGEFSVSLLSGHIGGANRLSQAVAGIIGGKAVVTTATDVNGVVAFDDAVARMGWRIINSEKIKQLNSLLLQRKLIGVAWPKAIINKFYKKRSEVFYVKTPNDVPDDIDGLVVLEKEDCDKGIWDKYESRIPVLRVRRCNLVLGLGCNRGVTCELISEAVNSVFKLFDIDFSQIKKIVSIDIKKDEKGLLEYADKHGLKMKFFSAEELKSILVPNPSLKVEEVTGSPSVAEASALCAGKGVLVSPKYICNGVTVAVSTLTSTIPDS